MKYEPKRKFILEKYEIVDKKFYLYPALNNHHLKIKKKSAIFGPIPTMSPKLLEIRHYIL